MGPRNGKMGVFLTSITSTSISLCYVMLCFFPDIYHVYLYLIHMYMTCTRFRAFNCFSRPQFFGFVDFKLVQWCISKVFGDCQVPSPLNGLATLGNMQRRENRGQVQSCCFFTQMQSVNKIF